MNKEAKILNYMKKLGLSREGAEQLYKDEEEDNLPELTTDQKKVEKEMRQADRKKENNPRQRKPNEDKQTLINGLMEYLQGFSNEIEDVSVINPEREIDFIFKNVHYKLTLAKPRK